MLKKKSGQDTAKEDRRCAGNFREAKVFNFVLIGSFRFVSKLILCYV
jgi:hypothetical protein